MIEVLIFATGLAAGIILTLFTFAISYLVSNWDDLDER